MGGGAAPLLRMSLSKQKSRKKYNIYLLICNYLAYYLFVICVLFICRSLGYPMCVNKKRDRSVQNRQCTPVRGSPNASISSAPLGWWCSTPATRAVSEVLPQLYSTKIK